MIRIVENKIRLEIRTGNRYIDSELELQYADNQISVSPDMSFVICSIEKIFRTPSKLVEPIFSSRNFVDRNNNTEV